MRCSINSRPTKHRFTSASSAFACSVATSRPRTRSNRRNSAVVSSLRRIWLTAGCEMPQQRGSLAGAAGPHHGAKNFNLSKQHLAWRIRRCRQLAGYRIGSPAHRIVRTCPNYRGEPDISGTPVEARTALPWESRLTRCRILMDERGMPKPTVPK